MKTYRRTREQGTMEIMAGNGEDRIEAIQNITRGGGYAKIDGCMIDSWTASLICQVYEGLNDEHGARYCKLSAHRMADVAYKILLEYREKEEMRII
jgi:hypothetical protein